MSQRIGLCFCHGWGFDPDFWKPLLPAFSDYPIKLWNLGYYGSKELSPPDTSADCWIAIGHSLGFRALMESPFNWAGAVCVQGFSDFLGSNHRLRKIRQRALVEMISDWAQNRELVLQNFYKTCGVPLNNTSSSLPSWIHLEKDLHSLTFSPPLTLPPADRLLVLGSRDDLVVTPTLMESEWGAEKIKWSETGGHALGFFESDFIAEFIQALICEVRKNRHS